jgi:septal ring factor EnvC (AmiA/AmiB activator)
MVMKIDIKSILILFLLAGCLIFGYMWYFKRDPGYKKELKELRADNERIKRERDSINVHLKSLEIDFNKLKQNEKVLQQKISDLEVEIEKSKQKANKSQAELNRLRLKLEETRRKIKELKNNPPNRTGDDLLNSIKIKTMKK